jgi:AraC-like DNA-binding protein
MLRTHANRPPRAGQTGIRPVCTGVLFCHTNMKQPDSSGEPCRLRDITVLHVDPRQPVWRRGPQRHPFHELVYILRGRYLVETRGMRWNGTPGWLYCYRPGQEHWTRFEPAGKRRANSEAILLQWTESGAPGHYPAALYDHSGRLRHLLNWLLDLGASPDAADHDAAEGLLPLLLRELARAAARVESLQPSVDVFIADNLPGPVRVEKIAEAVGLSRSHFSRAFKRLSGLSPVRYVARARLDRARALLARTDLTLAEIARRTGFSSASHLSRLFSRHYRQSPRKFRAASARAPGPTVRPLRRARGLSGLDVAG